jgi:hypothetical protein
VTAEFLSNFPVRRGSREEGSTPLPRHTRVTTNAAVHLDTLHPDLLVCEACQAVVCAVPLTPPAEPIDGAGFLTPKQVIDAWPEIGSTVLVHDVACGWRQRGTAPAWEWVEAR